MTSQHQDSIDLVARHWVARMDAGLNPADESALKDWRETDPRHAAALTRYLAAWQAVGNPREAGRGESLRSELARLSHRNRRRRWVMTSSSVAALVLAGILGWTLLGRSPTPSKPVAVVVSAPLRQTLSDGSLVIATLGSVWELQFTPAERRVRLISGQAHFQVTKNPDRPFVVSVGGVEFRAVGTAFSVQVGAKIELVVTEGHVAVSPPATQSVAAGTAAPDALIVGAGKSVRLHDDASRPLVTELAADELAEKMEWSHPTVEFSGARLPDVVAVLNRHNEAQLILDDPALADVTLTGRFRANDPETFTLLLKSGFGIRSEQIGRQWHLRSAAVAK